MAQHDPNGHSCHLPGGQESVEAYTQLRQMHQGLVRAQLRKRCHDLASSDVEDLEQEVWLAVWTALPRFHGGSTFPTWLVGITKNVFYRWLRHKRSGELTLLRFRHLDYSHSNGADETDPGDRLSVNEAIKGLSRPEHRVIELRYYHRLTDQEIAGCLNLPLGTVKGRIRSGLIHLRERFAYPVSVMRET